MDEPEPEAPAEHTAEVLCAGLVFPEGPRWHDDRLWFSDIRGGGVRRVGMDGEVERVVDMTEPSGLGFLPDGRLLVVGMHDRVLWRVEADRTRAIHADLRGHARAACNDMVVDGEGNAYVDLYDIGIGERAEDMAQGKIALVRPDGTTTIVAEQLTFPNGLVITPDGRTLIAAESGKARLLAFEIAGDGTLGEPRVWAPLPHPPDGICLDAEGAVWVANPIGDFAARYLAGGRCTDRVVAGRNVLAVALGGPDRRTLLLATVGSHNFVEAEAAPAGQIGAAVVDVPGAGWP